MEEGGREERQEGNRLDNACGGVSLMGGEGGEVGVILLCSVRVCMFDEMPDAART